MTMKRSTAETTDDIWHISEETRERRETAIAESREAHRQQMIERNGVPFLPSADLIREAREERDQQLDQLS